MDAIQKTSMIRENNKQHFARNLFRHTCTGLANSRQKRTPETGIVVNHVLRVLDMEESALFLYTCHNLQVPEGFGFEETAPCSYTRHDFHDE